MMGNISRTIAVTMLAVAGTAWAAPGGPTPESCRTLRLHGKNTEAKACFESLTRSGEAYDRAEGFWGLRQWEDAKREFEAAIAQPKAPAIWRVRYGLLFHERFNNIEAEKLLKEALQQDPQSAPAYVGLALVSADGFDEKAPEFAAKAVETDPKLVEAHEVLANLLLEDAKNDAAVQEADAAIALSPDALDAMAIRAAAAMLADDRPGADGWLKKIAAVNPKYGEGYAIVARHLVLNRRYPEGIEFYRKALAADPELWSAESELGINLMRMGEEEEPQRLLEDAYNNGQTDAATSNSLKLLESYKNFETKADATTVLKLNKKEADLLAPYISEQLHKAIATYTAKYKIALKGPVQLEVYPNHEDFAVRTMGMPGLGALGVTFGNVVAMDSPSGRKPGDFNWGATLWHEMSHVFILSATDFRVPRWFTEGLAVREEGQTNPMWANRLTPEVVVAIRDKKLLPVAKLDQGFIFPKYPEQVLVSYYQGGEICDYIADKWGNDALLGMVKSFAARKTTAEAIQANLHVSPEEFDKGFMTWLDARVGATVKNFDAWRQQLKALVGLASGRDYDKTIAAAQEVIKLYPEYVGDANAYEYLATAQLAKGDKQGASATLTEFMKRGGESPEALKKLASLQEALGHPAEAAATLNEINFIYPEDQELHQKLGALWLAQGNKQGAVREYSAVLAMNPLDKAQAHYDVARAYMAEGDKGKAEESVLASLEAAPGYKPAQKLLLEIEGK